MDSRKFLSDVERTGLEMFLVEQIETDTRNAVMLLTALHSGARATELLNLEWSDINIETGEIYIKTIKGGNPRPVVVPRLVRGGLSRLKLLSPSRPFDISYNRLGEIWRLYRPSKTKPFHCLRHTFAMHVYGRTKDIRFVQKSLGHRNIATTMVYADYSYSAQEFKKLMRVR